MESAFLSVIDTHTAGDPMREGVLWTNLTRSEIACGLAEEGFEVSVTIVDRLLDDFGFAFRKPQKVKTMGEVEDRNLQFEKIGRLKSKFLDAGQPVLSMDTKKREILGEYVRAGRVLSTAPLRGWDHDFPHQRLGVVIPHGLYDLARNEGYVYLGMSHDTSDFVVDGLRDWWERTGHRLYPNAREMLLLCDSGGSNSCRRLRFKELLQELAESSGLKIRVAHYPTYCSKYNPIEHRLFPQLTRVCQGVFLDSVEMVRDLMNKARTSSGLRVFTKIVKKVYDLGVKASDAFLENMRVRFDRILPLWNYVVLPR